MAFYGLSGFIIYEGQKLYTEEYLAESILVKYVVQ